MATLKTGSTVGGNIILHQGMMPLYPDGDRINYKSFKVYTEFDKPTPDELSVYTKENVDKQFGQLSSLGSPAGTWFMLGKVTLEQYGDTFKFEVHGGPGNQGQVGNNTSYVGVVRTGGGVTEINNVGRASMVLYNMGFASGITECGIIESPADVYSIFVKLAAGHEKILVQAASSSIDKLNKTWTPTFSKSGTPGFSLASKISRLYSSEYKPTNADIGLGNVSNERQVKLSGDEMTGPLIAQVSSKADAINVNDLPRLSQVNAISKASIDKLLSDNVPVSGGGTGASDAGNARKNLGFYDLGIAGANTVNLSGFDWQTYTFRNSAGIVVQCDSWVNAPQQFVDLYPSGVMSIFCLNAGASTQTSSGSRIVLEVTRIDTSSARRTYSVTLRGAIGSRVINIQEMYARGSTVPIEDGGTGAKTIDAARVNLVAAKSGSNNDITNLTGLVGSLKLGGDPVLGDHAATKRYVDNKFDSGDGGTGATMNGIMNYGVGTPAMAASRAFIQPYDVPQDGQLLNRADYPDLWKFAQMTPIISDADWLADSNKRGKYSTGDGTTTFRVPDWNGVQSNSIPGVFFRGGNGAEDMTLALNAAPNITGSYTISNYIGGLATNGSLEGAFYSAGSTQSAPRAIAEPGLRMGFNASRVSESYGRNNSSEIVPNKVSGVWVVRAKGAFIATNTSWSVINGSDKAPSETELTSGGDIISSYQVGGKKFVDGVFRSYSVNGEKAYSEVIIVDNRVPESAKDTHFVFGSDGNLSTPNTISVGTSEANLGASADLPASNIGIAIGASNLGIKLGDLNNRTWLRFVANGQDIGGWDVNNLYTMNGKGIISNGDLKQDNDSYSTFCRDVFIRSDIRVKSNLKAFENPSEISEKLSGYLYMQKKGFKDKAETEINWVQSAGLIAQEVQAVLPELITVDDSPEGLLRLNYNGIIALNTSTINEHTSRIRSLESQVEFLLQEVANLKANKK